MGKIPCIDDDAMSSFVCIVHACMQVMCLACMDMCLACMDMGYVHERERRIFEFE